MSNPILATTNSKFDTRVKEPSGIGAQVPPSGPGSTDCFNTIKINKKNIFNVLAKKKSWKTEIPDSKCVLKGKSFVRYDSVKIRVLQCKQVQQTKPRKYFNGLLCGLQRCWSFTKQQMQFDFWSFRRF